MNWVDQSWPMEPERMGPDGMRPRGGIKTDASSAALSDARRVVANARAEPQQLVLTGQISGAMEQMLNHRKRVSADHDGTKKNPRPLGENPPIVYDYVLKSRCRDIIQRII